MSSFPSDEQFDRYIAGSKRAVDAVNWKDLPTKVVYRVQPQGSIETKRGPDTLLELVNRESKEFKVWTPSTVVNALYSEDKKIPYIRSLGAQRKRKVFETVFLQDDQPLKKTKEEQSKLSKIIQRITKEEKKLQSESQSNVSTSNDESSTKPSKISIEQLTDGSGVVFT